MSAGGDVSGKLFPVIKLFNPVGTQVYGTVGGAYYTYGNLADNYGTAGTWTANLTGGFGMTPSPYGIRVVRLPGYNPVCCDQSGGTIYPNTTYSGSQTYGQIDVYNFTTNAGVTFSPTVNLQLTSAAGSGSGIGIGVYTEAGTLWNQTSVNASFPSGTLNLWTIPAGKYTMLVYMGGDYSGPVTYAFSITGNTMRLPQEAKANGSSLFDSKIGNCCAGDPINLGNGNLYEEVTDYSTVGTNRLSFSRYYNSQSYTYNLLPTSAGVNWRHNYDRYLHFISGNNSLVAAERPSGQVLNFTSIAGVWTPDSDVDAALFTSGSNWIFSDADDNIETYTVFSSTKGQLSTIKQRNGYTQTMTYTSGSLTKVQDSYGRALNLTYTSGNLTGVTTPDTLALTYGYAFYTSGNAYRLSSVSYNTSPVTQQSYLYENTGYPYALTGITDENGKRLNTWSYDNSGRANSSQFSSAANLTQITYDDTTGNRIVTGPLGVQETYKFTSAQGISKVIQIDRAAAPLISAASRLMTYDSAGYLATSTDWNGNKTVYTNNTRGDPTTIIYASGSAVSHTTTIAYDTTWVRLPKTITEPDRITTLNYDSSGNVLTRVIKDQASQSVPYFTSGTNRTWTYTWSSTGQLLTAQLPRTDVTAKTTLTYSSGALKTISDALSHVTTINTFKVGGLPLTITDQNSVLTTLNYNTRNWLTSSVLSLSSGGTLTTSLTYDSAGNLTRYTWPDNSYLNYTYDNAHRLTGIANILGETKTLTLNSAGNVTAELWKNASAVTTWMHSATYDGLSRLATDNGGMSQSTSYTYDAVGNPLTVTDALGSISTLQYDSLNRMTRSTDPLSNLTQYTYNAHDAVLSVTDPRSKITSYTYDGFGEMIQEVSPDRGTTVLKFDSDGNVSQQTDANAFVTNMTYDALDRILTRTYPADATLNVAFTYDQAGHGKGIGQLTSGTDQTGSFSRNYDERGLMIVDNRTLNANAYNTAFSYDSAGRTATITYASSGWMVGYTRDTAGQVTAVTDKPPSLTAVNIATSITHLPFGPVKSLTWANTITGTRSYDLDYRQIGNKANDGATNIYYASYGYNANNNITSITDNVTAGNNQTLTYNSADWLKFASGSYGTGINLSYDSTGNRLTYGATNYAITGTSNRFTSAGGSVFTYTSSGNVSAIGASPTFTYNKANQMATAVVAGTTSTYGYDAFGMRLRAQVGTTPVRIITYGLNGGVLTETSAGTKTDYIYLDGEPIGVLQPATSTVSYIHSDYLGTPQKATSAAKAVVWNGAYNPNGLVTPTTSINMNLRFPGQIQDVTGFYHNGFRDYNPVTASGGGKYLQADPIGLAGGINPYTYVGNNPYKGTDLFGLDTYIINRKLGHEEALPRSKLISHTFVATTKPDGSLDHTYSWGNVANEHGWSKDQPEDHIAAVAALRAGQAERVGSSTLDPYIDSTYGRLDNPLYDHWNGIVTNNCKTESHSLIDQSKATGHKDAVNYSDQIINQMNRPYLTPFY